MIDLTYVNRAGGDAIPEVLVMQMDDASPGLPNAIAWKVIRRCAPGHWHPFSYAPMAEICLGDEFGNFTERQSAMPGARFAVQPLLRGRELARRATDPARDDIALRNELTLGAVDACLYRNGRLLARRCALGPGRSAAFRIRPVLWLGTCSGARQGQRLGDAVPDAPLTALPLYGLVSATIALHGGGNEPYAFVFEEVKRV